MNHGKVVSKMSPDSLKNLAAKEVEDLVKQSRDMRKAFEKKYDS